MDLNIVVEKKDAESFYNQYSSYLKNRWGDYESFIENFENYKCSLRYYIEQSQATGFDRAIHNSRESIPTTYFKNNYIWI